MRIIMTALAPLECVCGGGVCGCRCAACVPREWFWSCSTSEARLPRSYAPRPPHCESDTQSFVPPDCCTRTRVRSGTNPLAAFGRVSLARRSGGGGGGGGGTVPERAH